MLKLYHIRFNESNCRSKYSIKNNYKKIRLENTILFKMQIQIDYFSTK